jgi:hypothetical protein
MVFVLSSPLVDDKINKVKINITMAAAPAMEVDNFLHVATTLPPAANNIPTIDGATDENAISDDDTVTIRGSGGPRPASPRAQLSVHTVTLKYVIQSTQALSKKEATVENVGNC